MKRLLLLNYEYPPLGGGGGVASHSLAQGFIQNGWEVDCVTSSYPGLKKHEVIGGVNVYRVNVWGRRGMQHSPLLPLLSYPIAAFWLTIRLCRQQQYTVINTHFVVPTGVLGSIVAFLFGIPNILSIHGGDIYDPSKKHSPHRYRLLRSVIRFLLRRATRVVAQSQDTMQNAQHLYKPKRSIDIIPLAYDPVSFPTVSRSDLQLQTDMRYVISVGRLVERKGFEYLLRAMHLLPDDICLLLVGDGPERAALEALSKELQLDKRVHFLGFVDEEKKMQYLSIADMYVLSSIHEGFGIVLQEAMSVGLPIVSTNVGGQVDFVVQNENGILVESRDSDSLAHAILQLFDNPALLQEMQKNNQAAILDFSTPVIAAQYERLLQ